MGCFVLYQSALRKREKNQELNQELNIEKNQPHIKFPILFFLLCFLLLACSKPSEKESSPTNVPEGMVYIPAGKFIMGSDKKDLESEALRFGSKPWYLNERPKREVTLDAFYIDKYEVINREYKQFLDASSHKPPAYWEAGVYPNEQADYPVHSIDWHDAHSYCLSLGKRLPAEAEWEKAARGTDGRSFPWGNDYDPKKANGQGAFGGPVKVGNYEKGRSPYGLYDMSGNVAEWVADWYKAYPGSGYEDTDYGKKFKVIRGGGWGGIGHYNLSLYRRTSYRFYAPPTNDFEDVGFRCVKSP